MTQKTLSALLAVARERISGSNPAGRNTGSPEETKLGDKPGVDYAPKAGDERKFVAKHKHIEQEYPHGNEHVFTGDVVKYSMDDARMTRYGNKEAEAIAANEETIEEKLTDEAKGHIRTALSWPGRKSKTSVATRALIKVAHSNPKNIKPTIKKEETEVIDEISKKLAARYLDKNGDTYNKTVESGDRRKARNRGRGSSMATKKLLNINVKVPAKEETEVIDEISKEKLGKYVKSAGRDNERSMEGYYKDKKPLGKTISRMVKRDRGIDKALSRLSKEETEVNELSKATLLKYKRGTYKVINDNDKDDKKKEAKEDFAGVPGPIKTDKKAVAAECTCPALECPIHTKLKANTKTNVGKMVNIKVGGFETKTEEKLHEISKKVLGSYVKKATFNQGAHLHSIGSNFHPNPKKDAEKNKDNWHQVRKRTAGIEKAVDRLTKEDANPNVQAIQTSKPAKQIPAPVLGSNNKDLKNKGKVVTVGNQAVKENSLSQEQIDAVIASNGKYLGELSDTTKKSYAAKATGDIQKKYIKDKNYTDSKQFKKRAAGINKAKGVKDDVDEETELDEISKKTLGSYVKHAAGDIAHHRASMAGNQLAGNKKHYADSKRKTINRIKGVEKAADKLAKEETELDEGNSREGYICKGKANYHGEMTRWHNDHVQTYQEMGNHDRAGWHEKAADAHDEATRHYNHASHFHGMGNRDKAYTHENAASGWSGQASDHEHRHKLVKPFHDFAESLELIEAAVLCDKHSLKKKMKFHKGRMKAEEIGSPKFKHHQRQIHTIKGMLEETDEEEIAEIKKEFVVGKNGFLVTRKGWLRRNREHEIKKLAPGPGKLAKEETEELDEISRNDRMKAIANKFAKKEGPSDHSWRGQVDQAKKELATKHGKKPSDYDAKPTSKKYVPEETEELDEISKKLAGSYLDKSKASVSIVPKQDKRPFVKALQDRTHNRAVGRKRAEKVVAKEEVDSTVARIATFMNTERK